MLNGALGMIQRKFILTYLHRRFFQSYSQMLSNSWKAQVTQQMGQLQAAVSALLEKDRLPDLAQFQPQSHDPSVAPSEPLHDAPSTSESNVADIAPVDPAAGSQSPNPYDDETRLVPAPMNNLYELAKVSGTRQAALTTSSDVNDSSEDLVSKGILSEQKARQMFDLYSGLHSQLLWGGVIFPYEDLESVRKASVLLSTAILTVAVLHTPGQEETLQRCYNVFIALVSSSSITRHHNLHDVRGLCLGAFHLPNLSWRLSGQAARIAAEMNIHQSFHKLRNGDTRHVERLRLWYALYICNHQVSIAFGRPSAMQDDEAVRNVQLLLDGHDTYTLPGDVRLAAHVTLYPIMSQAYYEFGSDPNQILNEEELGRLRTLNIAIEQWRARWQPKSADSDTVGAYPSQSLILYYHFARFHLNSLAFRGLRWPSSQSLGSNRREAAMAAIQAAMNTLVHVVSEPDIRRALYGVPIFTHTMVAFCATFLLKMASMWDRGDDLISRTLSLGFNVREVISLAGRSADLLAEVANGVSEKHVMKHIMAGIRSLLQRVIAEQNPSNDQQTATAQPNYYGNAPDDSFAVDFATQQFGGGADEIIYNMDVDSLAALLEFEVGEASLNPLAGGLHPNGMG
jgi:hypothetical protein